LGDQIDEFSIQVFHIAGVWLVILLCSIQAKLGETRGAEWEWEQQIMMLPAGIPV
jgi:hypothetical protein